MKRLDFLKSLIVAPAAVIAITNAPEAPKTFWKKYHAKKLARMRIRRFVGDIPRRQGSLLDTEIFTSMLDHPGSELKFFGTPADENGKITIQM